MVSIFDYLDYRQFLRDFYLEKKSHNFRFSYAYIAQRVGFRSSSFFGQILKGRSNVSAAMAARFADFLKLKRREADFFEALVNFNQAKSSAGKKHYYQKLMTFSETKVRIVRADQYEFYDKWYYTAIRELLYFYPFEEDYEALAKMLTPPIKASEARQAVALLLRLGFVRKDSQGRLVRSDFVSDSTGYRASPEAIQNFQLQSLALAGEALHRFPREDRSISIVTFSLSRRGVKSIDEELAGFRRKLLKIAEGDHGEDGVYQVNFQFFPLTQNYRVRKA